MDTPRKLTVGLLLGVLASLLAWCVSLTGVLEGPEHLTWDQRQRSFARPMSRDVPIRVILLDEQSLAWARQGLRIQWPWPYELYTPIMQFCRAGGAKAIAFELPFTEAGRYGPTDDQKLIETVAARRDIALAVVPGSNPADAPMGPESLTKPALKTKGLNAYIATTGAKGLVAEQCRFPFESLAQASPLFGHIAMDTNAAGQPAPARRVRPIIRFDGVDLPLLGLAAYLIGNDLTDSEFSIVNGQLRVGETTIPIGSDGRAVLRYRKPMKANHGNLYLTYSAKDVIQSQLRLAAGQEPSINPQTFKDCYVFFGFSATTPHDNQRSPVKALTPGVEVHATFLDNLLQGEFPRDASWYSVLIAALIVSVITATGVLWLNGWVRELAVLVVTLPIPTAVGCIAFANGLIWPIVWPTVAVGAALIGATVFNLATEGRQKRFIRRAFGHDLSPTVIDQVLADPSRLRLGGERREVTVMFIDLEDFTSLAEHLDPHELSGILNRYLSCMSDAILDEDGTLDKFQGDAVMAFWNAPLEQTDHALRACRAALRCRETIVSLRREWLELTGREPKIRIGLHTGPCVVGNMGAKQRFDYTVLGDTANLASRLEGVNKIFGTSILVSSQTWDQVNGRLAGRGIARVRVAGRKESLVIIEPFNLDPHATHPTGEAFDQALVFCEEGRYTDAMHRFHQLSSDPASQAYAEKIASILKSPGQTWDGVWDLTHE